MPRPLQHRFQYRKKIMGCSEENTEKKNVFAQKYDEIRSFDGMSFAIPLGSRPPFGASWSAVFSNSTNDVHSFLMLTCRINKVSVSRWPFCWAAGHHSRPAGWRYSAPHPFLSSASLQNKQGFSKLFAVPLGSRLPFGAS
jgi:hypothetical protein